jgi:hypothetical protein
MNRIEVIQSIIDKKKTCSYLEIGVSDGFNFFRIKARKKFAVDPYFRFSKTRRRLWMIKNPYNLGTKYFEVTSDDFFSRIDRKLKFDLIFIDGLHTYEQSLKDVFNSLAHLNERGLIIIHDCNPPHEAAANPVEAGLDEETSGISGRPGEWCGDVWKTICYLRSVRKDLKVFVLNCDYGLGMVLKGNPESHLNLKEDEINEMSYEDLSARRPHLLNLKEENYLVEFLGGITALKKTH